MRRLLTVIASAALFSTLAFAANWSGTLLDGSCYDRQYQQLKSMQKAAEGCAATTQTTNFALHTSGKVLMFDANGNSKAMSAVKNRADRVNPSRAQTSTINAKVQGTESADTIKVDSIEVQ